MSNPTPLFTPKFLAILAIFILVPLALYPSTLSMIHVWSVNETFTHGFLIMPISIWMIWDKRWELEPLQLRSEPLAFVPLTGVLFFWYVARIVDVQVAQHAALATIIPLFVLATLGRHIFSAIFFPLAYLLFLIPAGQGLIPIMMEFTAHFTVAMVQLTGIPIYQDGLYFSLPSGNWSVVEECSGVRYLIASMALGTLYAYMTYTSTRKRIIFILFSIAVPILANGIRAFGIVMLGHFSGMTLATGVDHLVYGWVFFGVVIFIMFYIGSFWRDDLEEAKPTPQSPESNRLTTIKNIASPAFVVAAVMVIGANLYASDRLSKTFELPSPPLSPKEINWNQWQYDSGNSLGWKPLMASPDLSLDATFVSQKQAVQVNVGFYYHQRQGAEAASTESRLVPALKGEWTKTTSTSLQVEDAWVEETTLRKGENYLLVWKWYRLGRHLTEDRYAAKAFDAYNQVILGRNDAAMITLATSLGSDKHIARTRLRNFYESNAALIYSSLEDRFQAFQALNN